MAPRNAGRLSSFCHLMIARWLWSPATPQAPSSHHAMDYKSGPSLPTSHPLQNLRAQARLSSTLLGLFLDALNLVPDVILVTEVSATKGGKSLGVLDRLEVAVQVIDQGDTCPTPVEGETDRPTDWRVKPTYWVCRRGSRTDNKHTLGPRARVLVYLYEDGCPFLTCTDVSC